MQRYNTGPGSNRTVAGPSQERIQNGLINFIQLVVVDDSGAIVAFEEARRSNIE
jgi:hypothetical protein